MLALLAFAAIAARVRFGMPARVQPLQLALRVHDRPGFVREGRDVVLTLPAAGPAPEIGRSTEAQIALPDPEVSRRHARFDYQHGVLYLTDLGSRNGTFLNGKRLNEEGIEVRPGDDIDVGNTRITVRSAEPAPWT